MRIGQQEMKGHGMIGINSRNIIIGEVAAIRVQS
jgi:hypothetical protein